MSYFKIYADYDQDGRLSKTEKEYKFRHRKPGAIVAANLDVDLRQLPKDIEVRKPASLDITQKTKSRRDNELIPIHIKQIKALESGLRGPILRITGDHSAKIRIYDAQGHRLKPMGSRTNRYELKMAGDELDLLLEVINLPGAPDDNLTKLDASFQGVKITSNIIVLELMSLNIFMNLKF